MPLDVQALIAVRERLGLSQAEVARRCGLSQAMVTKVERGERNAGLTTVEKLAKGLNVSFADLMDDGWRGDGDGNRAA